MNLNDSFDNNYSFCDDFHDIATLDYLNYEYMKEYLVRINAARDLRVLPKEEMAKRLHLVGEEESNKNKVKNFALLMFADRPEDYIPGAHIELTIERRNRTSVMDVEKFEGPIWIQAQQLRNCFKDRIGRAYTLRESGNIYHRIVKNWPDIAWNEISTNMILYKDYKNSNYGKIQVYLDRIVFTNYVYPLPSDLINDVNENTNINPYVRVNSSINDMFQSLHLVESQTLSIQHANTALKENKNGEVKFLIENEDCFKTIIYINKEFKKYEDRDYLPLQSKVINIKKERMKNNE